MAKRLRLRKDYPGEVFLGSYEKNQPVRISLTQNQPFVDTALRKKGLSDDAVEAELGRYEIYIPEILVQAPVPVPLADLKSTVKAAVSAPAPAPAKDPEPAPEEEPEEEEEEEEEEPAPEDLAEDSEDLQVDEMEAPELPDPAALKEMPRDELVALAEQLGVVDDVEGTGANGYVTVPDLRRFLIPHVKQLAS